MYAVKGHVKIHEVEKHHEKYWDKQIHMLHNAWLKITLHKLNKIRGEAVDTKINCDWCTKK